MGKLERVESDEKKREKAKSRRNQRRQTLKQIRRQGYRFESQTSASINVLVQNPRYIKNGKNLIWARKLVDTYSLDRRAPRYGVEVIIPKVPCDYEVIFKGRVTQIECKTSKLDLFDLGNIKPHQLEASELCEDSGSPYYFAIKQVGKKPVYYIPGFAMRKLVAERGGNPVTWETLHKIAERYGAIRNQENGITDVSFLLLYHKTGKKYPKNKQGYKGRIKTLVKEDDELRRLW